MSDQGWAGDVADTGSVPGRPAQRSQSRRPTAGLVSRSLGEKPAPVLEWRHWTPETFPNGPAPEQLNAPGVDEALPGRPASE